MSRTLHVTPRDDLIEHDCTTEGLTCICGPRVEHCTYDDAPDGWLIVHNSLDGRERDEYPA